MLRTTTVAASPGWAVLYDGARAMIVVTRVSLVRQTGQPPLGVISRGFNAATLNATSLRPQDAGAGSAVIWR